MPAGDVYQFTFNGSLNLARWAVVTHLQLTSDSGSSPDIEQEIADRVENSDIITNWKVRSTDETAITAFTVYRIHPDRGFPRLLAPSAAIAGSLLDDSLPANVGIKHLWYGSDARKRTQGRHTWPGVSELSHVDGIVIASALTIEDAFAEQFEDHYISSNLEWDFGTWSTKFKSFHEVFFAPPQGTLRKIRSRTPTLQPS